MSERASMTPRLDFALRFVDGKGVLGLGDKLELGPSSVERLELRVPNLRFPFDVSGGVARFQSRRCDFGAAELSIDGARLQAWLDGRARLSRLGIFQLRARLCKGRIELAARARVGESEAALTARVTLEPAGGQRLVARIGDVRLYGFLPAPAPLVGLGIAVGLGAEPDGKGHGLSVRGTGELSLNPLELILWRTLPPAGWRLPRYRHAALTAAAIDDGAIVVRYGVGAAAPASARELDDETRAAEALLARGDLLGAAEAFAALAHDGDLDAAERQLAVLAALPARWAEAETIGARLVAAHPDRPQPLCALAAIEAERGLHQTAASRYAKLAELAEAADERDDARLAALRAGELYMRVSPKEAIPWLERTLAAARDDVRAATLLCDAYAADGRWQDLLRLERWRLTQTEDAALEAEIRGRIARVWLTNLGDAVRARDELERALRGREGDATLWELYAQALERTGDGKRAREALGRAAAQESGDARAELELRAAALAEAAGERDEALAHARHAQESAPAHLPARERVASLLAALGRLDEAVAAFQDAIDRAEEARDDHARARLLVALAQLARDSLDDRHGARAYVERALAVAPTPAALELAAELAQEDGRLDDLERALAQLADGGDRVARLKHAEVLGELDRWQEAAREAEEVATAFPARAYALLARAYAALGLGGELRGALEQLAQAGGEPTARIRLAELRASDGDLDGARALLDDALDGELLEADDERRATELLCDVLMRLGDDAALEAALGQLADKLEDDAGKARALAAQGAARARLGRLDDARKSYREALANAPPDDDVQARVGLGEAAYALKRWDEARAALEPLYERGVPPRIERALRLGEIAERQGRPDDAVPFYEAALQAGAHAADAVRAYNAIVGLHHARGNFADEADALLRAADDARTQESDALRAGRLVAAADVLRKRGGQREQAVAIFERALSLDPLQIVALDALEALATEAGDIERVAQVLGRKVAATQKRPAEQRAILGRLAALQAHLGRPEAARVAYARALEIDPSFRPALDWMARDARERGASGDELAALERLAALPVDPVEPEAIAPTLARLGELYVAAGRRDDAERVARRALQLMPRHPTALAALDAILSERPASHELGELLAVRAEVETDFDVIVEILFRRAALYEGLGETRAAMQAYEQLIALRPSSAAAWNRLAALLRNAGEWAPLAQLLTRLAERHAADGRRAEAEALYVEIAHLAHDRLGDAERARAVLHKALEVEPKSKVALTSLLALARGRGDAGEEDELLGRLSELADDGSARAQAVGERARARHARGDLDGALALLGELPPATSPDAALKLRVEIAETRDALADAAPALEELRARAAAAHDDAGERWAIRRLLRVAAAQHALRSGGSEELARRALELDPDDRDAATLLYEIERARDDAAAQLVAIDRLLRIARRTFEGPAREAELGIESAEVLARGGDVDGALGRLREVLEVAPDTGRAHRSYGALLFERGQAAAAARSLARAAELDALDGAGWVLLGEAYERAGEGERAAAAYQRAGAAAPPKKRALAAFRAGKTNEARAAAIEALAAEPRDRELLRMATHGLSPAATLAVADELVPRLGAVDASWLYATLAPELGAGSDEERMALERSAALSPTAEVLVALGDRLDGAAAAARYESALALDGGCAPAAMGLARTGDPYAAARALQTAWDLSGDAQERARLSAARASLLCDRLGDAAGARQAIERALAEAEPFTELAPLRADLLRSQAALARAAGDGRGAEAALERLRSDGAATPDDVRHLAELYAERGEHETVVALLSALPGSSETLERALEATGRLDELAARLADEATRKPPSEARALLLRAATLATDRLADPRRAAGLLERALPLGPADAEVWARLGRLYLGPLGDPDRGARCLARAYAADRERAEVLLPLADFHYEQKELAPAADYYREALARFAVPADEAARVHLRLAEIAHARGDAVEEEQALGQALALGADQALPRLAALHRARGDGEKLAAVLLREAEQTTGRERAELLREAVPYLPADDGARLDEQILLLDPSDEEARDRVLSRLRASGDAAALIARLEREIPRASIERQATYARELGRLAERVGDEARAEAAWTTALAAAPSLEAARALWEILGRVGRRADAAPLFEAALEDPHLDPGERGELLRLAGEAYLVPGADAGRALAFVERARAAGQPLPLDPNAFRQLLRAERRFLDLVVALDAAATEAKDAAERERLELEAAEVLERDLGHAGDAARRYAALFDQKPDRREFATRARNAYAAASEPIYALAILDREMKLVIGAADFDQQDLAQLKIVRGELLLQAGADAEAEAEFLHALITTPRIGRAHAALADVYKKRGDLAGALEHLIAAADAPDLEPMRAAACAVDAADVLLVEGDSGTAERLYQLAAALDPADRRPVDALARLAAARADHERQADLLGRAAALTADRRERARLALQRARLFQNELKRELDAYRAYKEAVACDPNLREAARALREMAEQRGEWALAAEQRYRELALTTDAVERARLHVELAQLYEHKLLDGPAALRNYEQAAELALDASAAVDVAPWADLVRLYHEAQRWRDAALAAERLAASLDGPRDAAARAEALQRAGELHERAGDHERARQRLAEAAAIGGEAGRKADDSLLRLAEDEGDPIELRRRIEERLAVEPEGEARLELLRRLLAVAAHSGDLLEVDARSQEILARAPDDAEAFVQRKYVLQGRSDWAGLAQLLRARAAAVDDAAERAERRYEAGRLAETELYDVAAAAADYEAALAAEPTHVGALDALADLSYRTRHLSRARALYAQLGAEPAASKLGADEVWRRRGELAEEAGDGDEARVAYGYAVAQNPSNLQAHQSLARLALARGDDLAGYQSLRAVLELLPLDAVERITELRRHLGELAFKLGDREAARHYLELVLSQLPMEARALELLARIYHEEQAWPEAADALGRLSRLVREPAERADLLFRRGEVLRLGVGDLERANDAYLKAADLLPSHAPTLRRLVAYYYGEGDFAALKDVARELEALGQPLGDAAVEAGLGLALGGDEARGTVVVAVAKPTAARLAELLAVARLQQLPQLDPALRASARALGSDGRATLQAALEALCADPATPAAAGARLALARLHDAAGDTARARVQYAIGAFVDPAGLAATRYKELGAPEPWSVVPEQLVHPAAFGPLRDALTALAPHVLGLSPSEIDADPAPQWTEKLRAVVERATGVRELEACVVVELPREHYGPAWAEPTRPPRLLLPRRALADEAVARFAAVRAMHALVAGVALIDGRAPDDVAALLRAATSLFLPDLRAPDRGVAFAAFVRAWQAELSGIALDSERLPEAERARLEVALAAAAVDSQAAAHAADYARAERLSADRVALAATGDLRAGLVALAPADASTPEARTAALAASPLSDLIAFALAAT